MKKHYFCESEEPTFTQEEIEEFNELEDEKEIVQALEDDFFAAEAGFGGFDDLCLEGLVDLD